MMDKKKKPSLAIIMGMGKPEGKSEKMGEMENEGDETPHVDAAHGVLSAIKSNDPEKLSDALKTFYDVCKAEEEDSEGEGY